MTIRASDPASPGAAPRTVAHLGGRLVHYRCTPGEGPVIVFLSGVGVPSVAWDAVAGQLTGRATARLDRPGLFGTPWPGTLPTLSDEVATLTDLIELLGEPAILVAHSMAGLHAEAVARRRPDLVAGLVLVDGSVEWRPRPPRFAPGWLAGARVTRAVVNVPVLRRLAPWVHRVLAASQSGRRLTDPQTARHANLYCSPEAAASVVAENGAYTGQVWELADLRRTHPFPARPVLVLTAGAGGPSSVADSARLADLLGGRQISAAGSRHLIMLDEPDAIVQALAEMREET